MPKDAPKTTSGLVLDGVPANVGAGWVGPLDVQKDPKMASLLVLFLDSNFHLPKGAPKSTFGLGLFGVHSLIFRSDEKILTLQQFDNSFSYS